MSFENLPEGWTTLPLTTPGLAADVVDLCLTMRQRAANSLLLLPTDPDAVALPAPIVITDMDWGAPEAQRRAALFILEGLGVPGVVAATSHPTGRPTPADRAWRETFERRLPDLGIALHGFYVATGDGVFDVPAAKSGAVPAAGVPR